MICTGDEVMQGSIVDTNSAWLANLLAEQGINMVWRASVADDIQQLVKVFTDACHWCDLVIVNGGLGPTTDDLSAAAAAELLGEPLVLFEAWQQVLEQRYAKRFNGLSASNLKQAMLPQSASIIDNPSGSACGFEIINQDTRFWFTPGVPAEFKAMVRQELLTRIQRLCGSEQRTELARWHTFGLREAQLNELLSQLTLPDGMRFGFRAAMPELEVKLFYPQGHPDAEQLKVRIEQLLGEHLFSRQGLGFAQQIQALMLQAGARLATAESCTGGMIASQLVAVAGSSGYFERGFVTYSNQAKQEALGVAEQLLAQHGAVSLPVAVEMANGARRVSGADYGLATSGIAGPEGGTAIKPVGTVVVALATATGCIVQQLQLPDRGREFIRTMTAAVALDMLRRQLQGLPVIGEYGVKCIESAIQPGG